MHHIDSDFLIIGGGVMGLTTALRLAEQGGTVTLLDHGQAGREASWAGAGMLPPGNLARATTPEARLRSYSHTLWPSFSAHLTELTGIDHEYRVCGAIEIAEVDDPDSLPRLRRDLTRECTPYRDLTGADEVRRIAPCLNPRIGEAVLIPGFAQVRNPRHLKALMLACRHLGVRIVEHVESLRLEACASTVHVRDAGTDYHSDSILIAAGAWTDQILQQVGLSLPIVPVRGQMVVLQTEPELLPAVIEQGRRYLVPRIDGSILAGSTEEHCGFDKRTTAIGQATLLEFAIDLVPALADAHVAHAWAGLRPGSPDGVPFLGRIPGFDRLFVAAGHFRSGLQMSIGTATVLSELMMQRPSPISLDGLQPDRILADGSTSLAVRMVRI